MPMIWKKPASGTGDGQVVGSKSVVGDEDVRDLDAEPRCWCSPGSSDRLSSATAVGAWFGADGRCVNPKLRMTGVTAAVLVDDIEVAIAVHRDTFHGHVRHDNGLPDRRRSSTGWRRPRTIDVDDLARFLADHQQAAEIGARSGTADSTKRTRRRSPQDGQGRIEQIDRARRGG